MGRRQDFADYVEHCVVVKGVADLLQLVQQSLEHPSLNGVGRYEVEDEAIALLAVAVDAAHALFEPVRIPRDVVVEEDVAALKVDALPSRLSGDQHLDGTFAELLFGIEPAPRFVARAGLHAAVDAADAEAPSLQVFHQVVKGVLELSEEQQPLIGPIEEPLLLHDLPKMSELCFAARVFDGFGLFGKLEKLADLFAYLLGVASQRDGL